MLGSSSQNNKNTSNPEHNTSSIKEFKDFNFNAQRERGNSAFRKYPVHKENEEQQNNKRSGEYNHSFGAKSNQV